MKLDGACHCGCVRYEAEVNLDQVAICHCTDCQIISGSAFRTVVFAAAADFKLLSGVLKVYVKTAESGNPRAQAFCPECGTAIHSSDVDKPGFYSLRTGTARQRAELIPRCQIGCRSALPWVAGVSGIPSFQQQPLIPR